MNENREAAVVVEKLVKRFGSFTAVDEISFEVARGEIFGFLGPNGAGKSTTIRMLCGLLLPTAGQARVIGFDVYRDSEKIKQRTGYMSQKFSLYDDLRVIENIRLFAGIYNVPEDVQKKRIPWVLEMAGLTERQDSLTGTLAAGWKQRLALGCAVLHRPPILFLDEPTSGVDPISRRQFWNLIHRMAAEGVTVFVTTHYMDEAEYCDRLALIYRGRLVALGSPNEVRRQSVSGEVWEVECEPLMRAQEVAGQLDFVSEAAVFGSYLHVVVPQATEAERLRAHLESAGVRIARMEPILASLEDAFVSLVASEDRKRPEWETR